ncbi:hypothetical protein [Acinetobacter vivianii]|uniref:hypothetical protein n=1 Tax=Acinetobacter vivianii TaxID=1776742 RepID=UPI00404274A6
MQWWEKTVEYFFIKKYVADHLIAPLDGKHELAGDAILSDNQQKWLMIEFKDRLESLETEKKKFKSYVNAKIALKEHDHHHLLVYGAVSDGKFDLLAKTYFSRRNLKEMKNIFSLGRDIDSFLKYLNLFIKYKNEKGTSSSGNVGSYALIAGINNNNEITTCMSLQEFGLKHELNLDLEATPKEEKQKEITREREIDRDGPSFGF